MKGKRILIILSVFVIILGYLFLFNGQVPKPNILFITIDALRPDHLGCYGYEKDTSPHIDALAKEGILFKHALSQASWTYPSIHSIITATYPSTHNVYVWDAILSEGITTLPALLKTDDYYTGFMSGHGTLDPAGNSFAKDFNTFYDSDDDAGRLTEKATAWIRENKNKNFFLWIHYMDTHDKSIGFPPERQEDSSLTEKEIDYYTRTYDDAISYVDKNIALLIDKLKELEIMDNTMIILSADHGEEMGEHGFYFHHGYYLWDTVIQVPLIIFYPAVLPHNKIINTQVQHIDIAPTICDVLKVKKPKIFEGNSLLPLIKCGIYRSRYGYSELKAYDPIELSTATWTCSQFSIRSNEWKLLLTEEQNGRKRYQLFDVVNDPGELEDKIVDKPGQFERLRLKLDAWLAKHKKHDTPLVRSLNEEAQERLKSLGYMQ